MNQQNWNPGNAIVTEPRIANKDEPVRPDESAFGQFASLAGKLVQVPKHEVDAKRHA